MARLLLDTCAAIYMANGDPMRAGVVEAIDAAADRSEVFISVVTAWEVGLLSKPGRRPQQTFLPTAEDWYARLIAIPGFIETPLTSRILLESTRLPTFHNDPADRMLIATANAISATLVTRDRLIINDYAESGLVEVLRC
jgi:PIN domain nuclease of toxin-antitoxin system